MKVKGNILINIALIMFVIYSLVDRFIIEIPNIVAIPVLILGIVFIFVGFYKQKGKNN